MTNVFSQIIPCKALIVTMTSREIQAGEQIRTAYRHGYFDCDGGTEADRKGDTSVDEVRLCVCKGDHCFYGRSFIDWITVIQAMFWRNKGLEARMSWFQCNDWLSDTQNGQGPLWIWTWKTSDLTDHQHGQLTVDGFLPANASMGRDDSSIIKYFPLCPPIPVSTAEQPTIFWSLLNFFVCKCAIVPTSIA